MGIYLNIQLISHILKGVRHSAYDFGRLRESKLAAYGLRGRNAVYGIFEFLPKMTFFAVSDLDIRKERKNKARKKNLKKKFLMKKNF